MNKRTKKTDDPNVTAFQGMQSLLEILDPESVEPPKEKNPAAVALGKLGGIKGGKARAEKLTPAKRMAASKKDKLARED
mgnify:CR=1 FL=1